MAVTMTVTATASRPRRLTDSDSSNSSNTDDSSGSARGGTMFRRMTAQVMGLEATALCHRSHWVPKSTRSSCSTCRRPFRLWTMKHHCRFCGEVVCRNCSTQRILIERKTLRSCDACVSVNVQSLAEVSRRNSLNDLDARSSSLIVGGSTGIRKSDGALLRKSVSLPPGPYQMRSKRARTNLSKREASTGIATLQSLRRRYRTQLPYVVVVCLLTIAGLTNILVRRVLV